MFGEDGKDKLIKTLKAQIADRDARYSKLQKEKTSHDEALTEAKAAVESLRSRADGEEKRADNAESALRALRDDLAQTKLSVSNLETQLRAESARAADFERESRRLEYDLASLSHSGSGPSTAENKLSSRIKALEQELQRKEAEITRLARTFTPKTRRRRSSAGDLDLALQNQRDDATQAVANAQREISGLKARLTATERERDQALNARMAAEKRAARDTESLQDRVDELQFYLDQKGGSQPPQASDKARSERDAAIARAEELEARLKEKEGEVDDALKKLEERARELTALRDINARAERQLVDLQQKTSEMEAQMSRSYGAHAEREAQMERERDMAHSEAEALKRQVNDATGELTEARAKVVAEVEAHTALREQVEELQRQAAITVEAEQAAAEARGRAAQSEEAAATAAVKLAEAEQALATAEDTASAAESAREALVAKLDAALADVTSRDARVVELESQIAVSSSLKAELKSARNERERWRETAETYQGEIMEMEAALRDEIGDLERKLSMTTDDLARATSDRDAAQLAVKRLEAEILAGSSSDSQNEIRRLRQERDRLSAELQDKVLLLDSRDMPDKAQVEKMTLTIRRLRDERDEYKGQVAFVEAERKFADRATAGLNEKLQEALGQVQEKDTRVSQLEGMVTDLESSHITSETLKAELEEQLAKVVGLETTIRDLERQLTEAESARALLAEEVAAVATLDGANRDLQSMVASLESKISSLEAEASSTAQLAAESLGAVESERDAARAQLVELETEMCELRSKLDVVTANLGAEHESRKSAQNGATVQIMAADDEGRLLTEAQERVARRDRFIKVLEADKQKLDFKLKSLQDDFAELSEVNTVLEAKLAAAVSQDAFDQISGEHDALKAEHAAVIRSLTDARDQAARLQVTLESTYVDLDDLRAVHERTVAEHKALEAEHAQDGTHTANLQQKWEGMAEQYQHQSQQIVSLVVAVAVHRQALAATTANSTSLAAQLSASVERVATLEVKHAAHQQEENAVLRSELESARSQLRVTEEELGHLQGTSAELDAATKMLASLEARVTELEAALVTANSAYSDATSRASALEADLSVAEETRIELLARAKALQGRVNEMQDDLDAARTVHDGATGRVMMLETELGEIREALTTSNLTASDLRIKLGTAAVEFEEKLATAAAEAAEAETQREQILEDLKSQIVNARERAALETASANNRLKTAEERVTVLSETVDSLRAELEKMRAEHDAAVARAKETSTGAASLAADVARLQGEVEAGDELARSAAERIEGLVSELSMARADYSSLSNDLEAATADLEAAQSELDVLRSREAALVAQLDITRSELDDTLESLKTMQNRATAAETDARKAASHLNFMERGQVDMSARLAALRDELSEAQAAAAMAESQACQFANLEQANKALREALADIEEDLKYKTAALDAKNLDLEEADDQRNRDSSEHDGEYVAPTHSRDSAHCDLLVRPF
ncbi:hypothetical protein CC85DRAFT_15140 [Cutaneotrichosporon oleaginosum]|uniref:Uncharacterized protein n=1 Tax=Cutaneotrichosporon oleaginosum TaxID=879819 RepID=A0A0J0XCI9_9TREE|nr:uncharacterized protein CC85DRAFT_15140 [Cutaneotrichosporon oleaginosum]KLT38772.1 hypothetical protein CC85DRAFT_15140 [Cutaneotrichosporon oleaginosum]TXT11498.1 hypothetical protein COLE_01908 [Cutaneotrichosporon oleaginosum]